MTPALAIVIPTRNRAHCLLPLVEALQAQIGDSNKIQIVICDEASSPPVYEQLKTMPNNPSLKIVRHDISKGPAGARNAGWRASSAPWIWFLDDDVLPFDGAVAAALQAIETAAPDVGIIEGRITLASAPARLLADPLVRTLQEAGGQHRLTANIVYRREALLAVGGFDESFKYAACEDFDLAFRCENADWKHDYAGDMAVEHAVHGLFRLPAYLKHRSRQRAAVVKLYAKHPDRFGPAWIYKRFGTLVHRRGAALTTFTLFKFFLLEAGLRAIAARRLWRRPQLAVKAWCVHCLDGLTVVRDFAANRRNAFRIIASAGSLPTVSRQYVGIALAALVGFVAAKLMIERPTLLAMAIGGLAATVFAFARPRLVLVSLPPLILLEGAIRKWLVPGAQDLIYFVKDGLVVLLLLRWIAAGADRQVVVPPARIPGFVGAIFGAVLVYIALQLFNPRLPSLAIYSFGIKVYLLPLTLLVLVPQFLTKKEFTILWRWTTLAIVPIGALALVQSALPADHAINRYADRDMQVAVIGAGKAALVRATSTFSYISGLTSYLLIAIVSIPWILRHRNANYIPFAVAISVFGIAATIATGSRSPLVLNTVGLVMATVPLWTNVNPKRTMQIFATTLVLAVVVANAIPDQIGLMQERFVQVDDYRERTARSVFVSRATIETGGIFGWGPASAHQSRDSLLNKVGDWGVLPPGIEEETQRTVIELGVLGALLWYGFRLALLAMLAQWFAQARKANDVDAQLAIVGPLIVGVLIFVGSFVSNGTIIYLWCFWVGGLRLMLSDRPHSLEQYGGMRSGIVPAIPAQR